MCESRPPGAPHQHPCWKLPRHLCFYLRLLSLLLNTMSWLISCGFSNTSDHACRSGNKAEAPAVCLWRDITGEEKAHGPCLLEHAEASETREKSTWQSLHGFVGSSMRAELIEEMATGQLEIAKQRWWELPIQPSTEPLHPVIESEEPDANCNAGSTI